jgi:hypothetical protein
VRGLEHEPLVVLLSVLAVLPTFSEFLDVAP